MAEEIHVGDFGTLFIITVQERGRSVDISSMVEKKIKFEKPDQNIFERNLAFLTDGTDGKVTYTVVEGDLNVAGEWKLQVWLENNLGDWSSEITSFTVYSNLADPTLP